MASSNQTPDVLFSPIAANADASDINTIPQTYDPANYGYAAQNVGFPTECRLPVLNPDGTLGQGRAPRMQDWNGIMKLVSSHNFFLQNGGSYTFNPTVSSNIGGYPKNAILWYFPENEAPCLVYSLINDNTNNFVDDPTLIDGIHWEMLVNPSSYANIALTNSPYTTNRILEIPQDIKLELNNGTLTLKAGSKVYVPNGFEADGTTPKFDVLYVDTDKNPVFTSNLEQRFLFYLSEDYSVYNHCYMTRGVCSGGTDTLLGTPYHVWFDTTNNIIRVSDDGTTYLSVTASLSLSVCTVNGTQTVSIDQVFNGFGYIGSTVFALPGVKVQIPDGKNEDGTCKTKIISNDTVKTVTAGGTYNYKYMLGDASLLAYTTRAVSYNDDLNYNVYTDGAKIIACEIANGLTTSGKIDNFIPCTVDSVANSNASNFSAAGRSYLAGLASPSSKFETWTLGASGASYLAPANGHVVIRKISGVTNAYLLLRTDKYLCNGGAVGTGTATQIAASVKVSKGDTVYVEYSATGNTVVFGFVYDKGEV